MQDTPNPDPAAATEASPSSAQRRGMRAAMLNQSCGVVEQLSFKYGIILLYLRSLGIPATRALVCVALPLLGYLLTVPVAYYADRWGRKRLATFGLAVSTAGMALLALSGSLPQASREAAAVLGLLVFPVAQVPFRASWYALLSPVVTEHMCGRFLGRLRLFWQAVGVAFASVCVLVLSEESPLSRPS